MKIATFAERLNDGLTMRGMNAAELAHATGIGESSISQYKSGKYEAKQDKLYVIAKALNVNEAWLMGYDVSPERVEKLRDNLTADEETVLYLYSQLDERDKGRVLGSIETLLSDSKYKRGEYKNA